MSKWAKKKMRTTGFEPTPTGSKDIWKFFETLKFYVHSPKMVHYFHFLQRFEKVGPQSSVEVFPENGKLESSS